VELAGQDGVLVRKCKEPVDDIGGSTLSLPLSLSPSLSLVPACSGSADCSPTAQGNPITNDWVAPQNRLGLTTDTNLPAEIEQNAYARDAVLETIVASKRDRHRPTIYTLPKNSKLEPVQRLEISQDIKTMQVTPIFPASRGFSVGNRVKRMCAQIKLAKDITSIMGIPYELVGGGYSDKEGRKKSMENTRIFTTNMMNLCKHLEFLLRDVYVATYGGRPKDVRFTLRPTPRIEIGSVEVSCFPQILSKTFFFSFVLKFLSRYHIHYVSSS
jgi:hypothetical protein